MGSMKKYKVYGEITYKFAIDVTAETARKAEIMAHICALGAIKPKGNGLKNVSVTTISTEGPKEHESN